MMEEPEYLKYDKDEATEEPTVPAKEPVNKIKGKIGHGEYRPGRWWVYFTFKGKQVHLTKGIDGQPLRSEKQCITLIVVLKHFGYDTKRFGGDNTYQFKTAFRNWMKLATCSRDWAEQRERLGEKYFIPFFKTSDIREIRTPHIDQLHVLLKEKGLSEKYIKNVIGVLKAFFRYNKKVIPELPDFRPIEVQPKPIRWMTPEEQDTVFEFLPQHHLPIFTFLRAYGTRLNEAAGLIWENVYLDKPVPYFVISTVMGRDRKLVPYTKTRRVKVLPIADEVKWVFQQNGFDFVFVRPNGQPYRSDLLRETWERANAKAHKKYGTQILNVYNSMRHSFAMQKLNSGTPLELVSAILGHTNKEMTNTYAKYGLEQLKKVIGFKRPLIKLEEPKLLICKEESKNEGRSLAF